MSGTRADRLAWPRRSKCCAKAILWSSGSSTGWAGRSSNWSNLVGDLHKHGVQFRSLTDSIDTGTPSGRFFFHVMASLAEMERELTVERTRAGLEVAKQLGRKGGRKPKMTDSKIGVGQEAAGQRGAAQGRGQEPRRVHSDAVPLGASLHARLACFI
ncbi:Resolvase domain-containing protein [Escherichia coli]|uniref:Resolvase domain-containing protein n=1 Tax=Escherichia coli TaxID=562 RepID=A0A377BDI1_ECOLX|nr:Resolvase domain-containing protein [Escherichia coli]